VDAGRFRPGAAGDADPLGLCQQRSRGVRVGRRLLREPEPRIGVLEQHDPPAARGRVEAPDHGIERVANPVGGSSRSSPRSRYACWRCQGEARTRPFDDDLHRDPVTNPGRGARRRCQVIAPPDHASVSQPEHPCSVAAQPLGTTPVPSSSSRTRSGRLRRASRHSLSVCTRRRARCYCPERQPPGVAVARAQQRAYSKDLDLLLLGGRDFLRAVTSEAEVSIAWGAVRKGAEHLVRALA